MAEGQCEAITAAGDRGLTAPRIFERANVRGEIEFREIDVGCRRGFTLGIALSMSAETIRLQALSQLNPVALRSTGVGIGNGKCNRLKGLPFLGVRKHDDAEIEF